jgi:pilus assembly protein Flp/PilA
LLGTWVLYDGAKLILHACDYAALEKAIVKSLLVRFLKDDSGATAIEYGLIAAGVSLAIIAVVSNLGTKLKTTFSSISTQLH